MKMNKILTYLAVFLMICSCKKSDLISETVSPAEEMVMKINKSDRVFVTEYVINKIVTYEDVVRLQGKLFSQQIDFKLPQGDRKVLIPMQAHLKAYIDFSGFGFDNIKFSSDSNIVITLPDPKIILTSTKIDHAGVKKFVDFGRSKFTQTEISEYERQGREAIIEAIPKSGLLETARLHAYEFLLPIVLNLGYKPEQVVVNFDSDFIKGLEERTVEIFNQ